MESKTPLEYSMRISRLTVDKLGVKLYDKVSAVIAELIANAYDADAHHVIVRAPMGRYLAEKKKETDGERTIVDKGYTVQVCDDGTGMTPREVQDFYLVVGAERRGDDRRGTTSHQLGRKVMGRKGVGKLAPFGICKTIELISAGGERVFQNIDGTQQSGFLTSHIILDYDSIVAVGDEPDERYTPKKGNLDHTLSPATGTKIVLSGFSYRMVSNVETLSRQIAQRFGIRSEDWQISLIDNTAENDTPQVVGEFAVRKMPNTNLTFKPDRTVLDPDGNIVENLDAGVTFDDHFYPVEGWMAYAAKPYQDDLMAGIRIYCRGKIAAQTSVFNRKAGFTGEHNIRSYLVGELHADWLDEEDDLIQTDRRDILWSEEPAARFQEWGQRVVEKIGSLSRDPMRKATLEIFRETGKVHERIAQAFPSDDLAHIRHNATELADVFGRAIKPAEAQDSTVVNELVDLCLRIAPHKTLNDMMKKAAEHVDEPLEMLTSLLQTARLAELTSFGEIATDRLNVIEKLQLLKNNPETQESDLQRLIEDAPWLINPEWAPVTENQAFSTLRSEFEKYYQRKTGTPISISDFRNERKRPDFVMANQESIIQIIEIKAPEHRLANDEVDRIVSYYDNMVAFLDDPANETFSKLFTDFHITVICENLGLSGAQNAAFEGYKNEGRLTHMNWGAFLLNTRNVHQDFLDEAERQRQEATSPGASDEVT